MKKIGIVTLVDYQNYGNRLQAYATQQIFKKLDYQSELIRYKKEAFKEPLIIKIKIFITYFLFFKQNLSKTSLSYFRKKNFKKHSKKYLIETANFINPHSIGSDFHKDYSFLSVGSDQIWGWFNFDIADLIFLKFAPKEKRIAFAPSFGSDQVDEKYQEIFSEGLKGIVNLSVREESGAKIIKNFTGKEATVICDPTMCLSKNEWIEFSTEHSGKPKKNYILTYFLGEVSEKASSILNHFSNEFEIVELNSVTSPKYYTIDPSHWVDLVKDANLFLTDSFHGVVFSLILQTPFAVYSRVGGESMETRISNILQKFALQNRFEMTLKDDSLFSLDFSKTEDIIDVERSKAFEFLQKSVTA